MARSKPIQTSFSAGELAPELALRHDTNQYKDGARSLLNQRLLISGAATRRPGTERLATRTENGRLVEWIENQTTKYLIVFGQGTFNAYLTDGTAAGSLTGCAWTGAQWSYMDMAQSGNVMVLTTEFMEPQILTRTGAATWTVQTFAFFVGIGARIQQPYYKFADQTMTLTPSALSGAVTLVTSAAFFESSHIGIRIRYLEREIFISDVTNTTTALGIVIERLPSSTRLTVTSTVGFAAGEVVLGDTSGSKAQIVTVVDATTLAVVSLQTVFVADLSTSVGALEPGGTVTTQGTFVAEDLLGPHAQTAISVVAPISPLPVSDWDEQVFSLKRGYPGAVEIHRNRLWFSGHTALPNAVMASSLRETNDFDVGDASDADAIFEFIGDAGAAQVLQMHSAEQLLLFTDKGAYYVPESVGNPIRPTSIAFAPFTAPWEFSRARTRPFDGGVLATSGSMIIKCKPTGDITRAWIADAVSILSSHLIDNPTDVATVSNYEGGPENYALFVNNDDTMAVMQLIEAHNLRNFTPWTTNGIFRSVVGISGELFALVERTIDEVSVFYLEKFSQSRTLDVSTDVDDLEDVTSLFGDLPVNVLASDGSFHLGTFPLDELTEEDIPDGPFTIGINYDTEIETWPPVIQGANGSMVGDYMRIMRAEVSVLESALFTTKGYQITAYQIGEDSQLPAPLKNGPQRFRFPGWRRDPTITITQADPLPLTVLGIKMEVAWS